MTNRSNKPPEWASKILFRISKLEDKYSLLDDLEIEHARLASDKGGFSASVWYIAQVFKAIPGILISTICWRLTMYNNYIKIALRNLRGQKGYSFINITGLAVGMACCILISLWILDELNYDGYHENAE
ncbi:MAG: ABC transporter permease, partial [bacterium]|nr:ABC transporter permease [bacterium]